MRGSVSADGSEAVLALRAFDPGGEGRVASVEAMIDTGFTGHLTLPPNTVGSLAFPHPWSEELVLADGSMEIGMTMLSGSRLQLDATLGGEVTVEEISQAALQQRYLDIYRQAEVRPSPRL